MNNQIVSIKSITQAHQLFGMPSPKHPLISLLWAKDFPDFNQYKGIKFNSDLYMIGLKDGITGSMSYGRNSYDFTQGTMVFSKPNQVMANEAKNVADDSKGWLLFFHPDLIRKSELGATISQYSFFNYEVHEALHLSEEEKNLITDLVHKIEIECEQNIDKHSQKLMVSNIELILDYCTRYYDRQFYVRTNLNQDFVNDFEQLLLDYFTSQKPLELGLPSVVYCGEQLNMSSNYLSDLLKKETGKSAKNHIHDFVINKAKNQLLGTTDSISEIAYGLGFAYSQHFSKLFKSKTGVSPVAYRRSN